MSEKPADVEKTTVAKAVKPLASAKGPSSFSIEALLNKKDADHPDVTAAKVHEQLPASHFTETDLQSEWQKFLSRLKTDDIVIYSAVSGFNLAKTDENTVRITYPSETAKAEFEKIQAQFFNHFKHVVNHFSIKTEFRMDTTLKVEVMTKRKVFEKFADLNPLLKELDECMKFDFS